MSHIDPQQAFTDLLRLHHSQIYGFIYSLVHDADDAHDLYQETAVTLWKKFGEFREDGNFGAWACAIARNKLGDFFRSRRRQKAHFGESLIDRLADIQAVTSSMELDDRHEALLACMQLLPDAQRELLRRCYQGRDTVADIAAALGRTVHSVHSSLRHIRAKLFDCIQRRLAREGA